MKMINNVFKKGIAVMLSLAMLLSFASCSERHPRNKAIREAKKYFEYLKNEDTKKLNKLFSDDVRDTHDLDEEWDDFYDSIDGNIISYGSITSGGEGGRYDFGRVTYSDIVIIIEDVKTDTGMEYDSISYYQIRIDKKHPEREGIGLFSLEVPSDNEKGFEEVIVGEVIIYYD